MNIILHITTRKEWERNVQCGYYKPQSLTSDGFIHCSTITQTADTANRFFPNQKDLVLLFIDENKTEPEVRYEGPACEGDQRTDLLFPHIYGPLNMSAVVRIVDFIPKEDGTFDLPQGIEVSSRM